MWRYLAEYPNPPRYFINLSSRYNMKEGGKRESGAWRVNSSYPDDYDYISISGSFAQFFPAFEKQGFYDWKAKVAGQPITVKVTPDMFEEFIAYDTTFVNDQTKFPNVSHRLMFTWQA